MKPTSERERHERQDWGIVLLILLIGFLCVIVAGQRAMRFAPRWALDANVESNVDLNSEFLTSQPVGYFEPLDPAILTQPGWAWANAFLTPGAAIPVGTPLAGSPPGTAVPTVSGATSTITGTVPPTSTGTTVPTNTLVWIPLPATNTPKPKNPPPADTPTDTPFVPLSSDLVITIDDALTGYGPGRVLNYNITVTNNGPDPVTGAVVVNSFDNPGIISAVSWTCPGANCPAASGTGNLNVPVNLPVTGNVVFTVTAQIWPTLALPSGGLTNTASVSVLLPNTDPAPGTNTDFDSDVALMSEGKDCSDENDPDCLYDIPQGQTITLMPGTPIEILASRDAAWDLVYYERAHPEIYIDVVRIQIGDTGGNWYTVFEWGDGIVDPNTIITSHSILPEADKTPINAGWLYGASGLAIDVDHLSLNGGAGIPVGTYPYVSITALVAGDTNGACGVDGIEVLP